MTAVALGTSSSSSSALHAHDSPPLQFCSGNASISIIDLFPDGGARIVRLNDCRHLVPLSAEAAGAEADETASGGSGFPDTEAGAAEAVKLQAPAMKHVATAVGPLLTGAPL